MAGPGNRPRDLGRRKITVLLDIPGKLSPLISDLLIAFLQLGRRRAICQRLCLAGQQTAAAHPFSWCERTPLFSFEAEVHGVDDSAQAWQFYLRLSDALRGL